MNANLPLDGRGDGVEHDGIVESPGELEAVRNLLTKRDSITIVKLLDLFEQCR